MAYLTIGTLWKNEHDIALDFVKYHKHVGVEKFVIFDREFHKLQEMFKDDTSVEIHHYPDEPGNVHAEAWAKLIGHNKGKTKWLALIDADQALVPVKTDDVKVILREYEQYASLGCNWNSFGSGGQIQRTPGSLYERFLMRAKNQEGINNHCQAICQPDRTLATRTNDPHHVNLPHNEITVNTNKVRVNGPFNIPPLHDTLWVAHYINRSKEEAIIKQSRGRADIFGAKMPTDLFDIHEEICNAEKEDRVLELWNKANGR